MLQRARTWLAVSPVILALACSAGGEKTGNRDQSGGNASGGHTSGPISKDPTAGTLGLSVGGTANATDPGCPTSISGTVYDPAGKLPLYNVVVYQPSEALAPLKTGSSCETCDGNFSGHPVAAAVSDAAGHFKLEGLKATEDVPLVIQVGKWRRQITVPSITACQDNVIEDPELFRLPRSQAEGDLPQMAVVRGGSEALECLLHKLGVDDSEFTGDGGKGRVHLYVSEGGTATAGTGTLADGTKLGTDDSLLDSPGKMKSYDMLLLGCEGTDNIIEGRPATQYFNVRDYADQGGRIFGSHYHDKFIWNDKTEDKPYPEVVKFQSGASALPSPAIGTINTSFPKGAALADWLVNVKASTTRGQISIIDAENTVQSVLNPNAISWIASPDAKTPGAPIYFSFPTPIAGPACGRMVFSDIHVASGSGDTGKEPFPSGCTNPNLTPQQAALAFMIFDLSSCVQPETDEVRKPIVK
ncbi:MAG TPA: carboxypeptidase regulatory-like domain-containing protein [Polyangiaceae bacterium]|nr:carboxypeptidase regulatory-like domain-containing protein [Polyangiaceae bacterium]